MFKLSILVPALPRRHMVLSTKNSPSYLPRMFSGIWSVFVLSELEKHTSYPPAPFPLNIYHRFHRSLPPLSSYTRTSKPSAVSPPVHILPTFSFSILHIVQCLPPAKLSNKSSSAPLSHVPVASYNARFWLSERTCKPAKSSDADPRGLHLAVKELPSIQLLQGRDYANVIQRDTWAHFLLTCQFQEH